MKNLRVIGIFLLLAICASSAVSQGCAELQKLIVETYNFKPSKLNAAEQTAKSAKMDFVWNKVETDPKGMMPCLREAINTRTADTFFRFDAVNLLLKLDQSADTKKILIKSYADVDLGDVDPAVWMRYVAYLGYEGFDTSAAAENWLGYPDPGYYLRQHGILRVNKIIGAVIIYGSMDESIATPALVKIASNENHPAREIAVWLLSQQATPESFRELKKLNRKGLSEGTANGINVLLTRPVLLAKRESPPKVTRQQYLEAFQQLAEGKPQAFMTRVSDAPDGERDVITVMKEEDIPLIRKARRVMMLNANPHSAEWYNSFTKILMAIVWKPELTGPCVQQTKPVNPGEK